MKYRGVAYYPEAWPPSRWDEDIRLMIEAGINLVRMGEFAWARFEPEEGDFTLGWFVDICERLHEAGISILACTPSAAPPAWLAGKYPDALACDQRGRPTTHGSRRHNCPVSPVFRQKARTVNEQLADALKTNPSVIAWQIDNEVAPGGPDGYCCCPACTERFQNWLKAKYGTLKALNDAWGNVFWSGDFSSWDQIRPPYRRISWQLDYARFQSEAWADFVRDQAETLRPFNPDWRITTNSWIGIHAPISACEIFDSLDFAAFDGYIGYYASRDVYGTIWDMYRNVKGKAQPFWLAETNAWHSVNTEPGRLKALGVYPYHFLAHGADAMVYFRWRQSIMGEEDHPAVLEWSGMPSRAYEQVKTNYLGLKALGDAVTNLPLPKAKAAILYDYELSMYDKIRNRAFHSERTVEADVLLKRVHILPDVLPIRQGLDLSAYSLVVLPNLQFVPEWLAAKLKDYVRAGGVLLGQPMLADLDPHGKYHTDPIPKNLTDLFGLTVRERWQVCDTERGGPGVFEHAEPTAAASVEVELDLPDGPFKAEGVKYMEMMELSEGVSALGRYTSGSFLGTPFLVEKAYGKGLAIYQACWLDAVGSRVLFDYAIKRANLARGPETPAGIEIIKRGNIRFYLNHLPASVSVPQVAPGRILKGHADGQTVSLNMFDVCLIEEEKE